MKVEILNNSVEDSAKALGHNLITFLENLETPKKVEVENKITKSILMTFKQLDKNEGADIQTPLENIWVFSVLIGVGELTGRVVVFKLVWLFVNDEVSIQIDTI